MTKVISFAVLISAVPAFALLAGGVTATPALKPVKIVFVEALDPKDTTSSKRFQDEYEAAIAKGRELTAKRLASCGYQLDAKSFLYAASDPIQAKEQAEKAVKDGAWLIVGPRRSNHYLLLAKGAEKTPTVSLMASSEEVASLGALHLSMAPSNAEMARAAAREAAAKAAGRGYVSIISADCLACKDFAKHFDLRAARLGLVKLDEIPILGEQPDLGKARETITRKTPAFVLLPNYSIVSSYVISELRSMRPEVFFVGGDGWGTSKFGFVQKGRELAGAAGITVRGNPPAEQGFKSFPVGKELLARGEADSFGSASALAILRLVDATASLLCDARPKDPRAFTASFAAKGGRAFSSPWGVSLYRLDGGNIVYEKSTEAH